MTGLFVFGDLGIRWYCGSHRLPTRRTWSRSQTTSGTSRLVCNIARLCHNGAKNLALRFAPHSTLRSTREYKTWRGSRIQCFNPILFLILLCQAALNWTQSSTKQQGGCSQLRPPPSDIKAGAGAALVASPCQFLVPQPHRKQQQLPWGRARTQVGAAARQAKQRTGSNASTTRQSTPTLRYSYISLAYCPCR